jgi:YaiO family outer membrane protein
MRRWIVVTTIAAAALAGRTAHSEQTLEVGGEYGTYTGEVGHTVSEFASYTWPQGPRWTLRADASHESRFDDDGFGFGFSAQRDLGKVRLGAGLSSGTGDVIHPEYRFDVGGQFDLPVQGMQATAGYTRLQSKGDNSSDGFSVGLLYWYGGHWIFGASGRHEIGHPGDTSSNSADLSVTWFQWLRVYVGVGYRFGAVSYLLLGPSTTLVDYDETDLYATVSWHLRPDLGFNARFDVVNNDVYDLTAARLSLFKQW